MALKGMRNELSWRNSRYDSALGSPIGSRQAKLCGLIHQFRQRISLYLSHHATSMRFHGDLAYPQLESDLLVSLSDDNQSQNLSFSSGQTGIPRPERADVRHRERSVLFSARWLCRQQTEAFCH